jgi:hypothetical protein
MAKVTPKKTGAKKTAAPKKKTSKKSAELVSLSAELKSLIPKLDEEGLAFLVKQAHVHLYNMQVDALNNTLIKDEERIKVSVSKKKTVAGGFSGIKKSGSGSSYYIVYGNESIIFSREEMELLVKIVLGEGTDLEIRERLYNWLSGERSDLLYAASIGNKFDDKLKDLVSLLKGHFKLKKK